MISLKQNILITGCAGFIGFHTSLRLLKNRKAKLIGIDNLNSYYDVKLKKDRLNILKRNPNFLFHKIDICDQKKLSQLFRKYKITEVIHLAAQAGVRYSIKNPDIHVNSNIVGYANLLEICKIYKIKHLIFASSSSVYGSLDKYPYKENMISDNAESIYAATKKSGEIISHSYSYLHNLPITVLRFFTVYGPYGRPDMAIYKFTKGIFNNTQIDLYNYGKHQRDFTHVDDVVDSIILTLKIKTKSQKHFKIYNVGSGSPKKLIYFLEEIEKNIGKKALIKKVKLQEGDVFKTHADISKISKELKFKPKINFSDGISSFVNWYREYHKK